MEEQQFVITASEEDFNLLLEILNRYIYLNHQNDNSQTAVQLICSIGTTMQRDANGHFHISVTPSELCWLTQQLLSELNKQSILIHDHCANLPAAIP
ncbi:hypothetical protein [Agathobaculum sp. Marseille-P7918]|uniref:hypothetical protein n=1 Tax=Agathobaculum sp. Marseille-P7918 TaxID=2479843 RepID=UPI0035645669